MSTGRRADIQGLRAVAVLVVVLFHAQVLFDAGYLGVDVFFVVSGFVITQLLDRERSISGRVSFRSFYSRRVKRLLPALAVMMAVVLPASILFASHGAQADAAGTGMAAAMFNANTYLAFFGLKGGYFALDARANPLLHTWSLSVEEQFYFLYPALMVGLYRIGRRPRRSFLIGVGLLSAVSLGVAIVLESRSASLHTQVFYLAPFRVWEFGVGAICAAVVPRISTSFRLGPLLSATGLLTIVGACLYDDGVAPHLSMALACAGTAMLLVGGAAGGANPVRLLLGTRPLVLLGDISYSWYLWHWPLIVFAQATWGDFEYARIVAAFVSLAPAALSYRFVEGPLRIHPAIVRRRVIALAGACIIVPLVAAQVLYLGEQRLQSESFVSDARFHLDARSGCVNTTPIGERDADSCYWTVPAPKGDVLLIGDSSAGQFTEAVTGARSELSLNVRVATMWGCPFISLTFFVEGEEHTECEHFVAENLNWIRQHPPDLVVLSVASDYYIATDLFEVAPQGATALAQSPQRKAAVWQGALRQTIDAIIAAGSRVLLVHTIPKFSRGSNPYTVSPFRLMVDPDGVAGTQLRTQVEANRLMGLQAEVDAARDLEGVSTIDVIDQICPGTNCSTLRGSTWMYRDRNHISISASEDLTDTLRDAMGEALR